MKNNVSLSLKDFQDKLQQVNQEVKKLQEEKSHIEYVIDNIFKTENPLFKTGNWFDHKLQTTSLDPSLNTKPLIIEILKSYGRKRWRGVWEIFHELKPTIARGTVQVSLSQMSRSEKYPVKQENGIYWYEKK